jgi:hypothetical protein
MAQQMSVQMADAITAFLAPRVQGTGPSPDHDPDNGATARRKAALTPRGKNQGLDRYIGK